MMRSVLDSLAQYVDHAALGDLALYTRKELLPSRTRVLDIQRPDCPWLGCAQERRELLKIHCVFAIVVAPVAKHPAHAAVERGWVVLLVSLRRYSRRMRV